MTHTHSLTPDEVAFFDEHGYVGPFDLASPEAVATARRLVDTDLADRESPIYGVKIGRDWHLASREIFDICAHPAIVGRLRHLLGDDILLWRSQMFYKKPGDGETLWHQDSNFPGPLNVPSIEPSVTVTAWIALDEATVENGCVELVAGSHKAGKLATVSDASGEGIFGRNYRLARDVGGDDTIAKMTVKPGQFFLFSNLTVHGSGPNLSDTTRLGIGVRFTSAAVRVYPGLTVDGQGMSLEAFGCVLVSGEDRYRHNRMRRPPEAGVAAPAASMGSTRDTGFKMGYGVGYSKGERHVAKGIRVNIEERVTMDVTPKTRAFLQQYGDPDELAAAFREGLSAGYSAALAGQPFDSRFASTVKLPGSRLKRLGPARKILRRVLKLAGRA
jgi:non-heme Fe2+,alpha-ketoglutarate-dependent halogenase